MNKRLQGQKLNEAIYKLESARNLIKTNHLNHAKQQIHEAVASMGSIVHKKRKKNAKSDLNGGV
ncbi:hypothetical protein BK120_33355 [Paenibacillus sp. FSL A5-0031]|uniref:hypothetical protein n=1 Tax=Paenibacillus sp. FSL A5-0031 TaxID=1920420 RepID=UPI00096E0427|nr:hypothetical protein [Paenibacillus sp. FSL A5-0031]OME71556.1 hypothetical protein BK120_33355 [Paenibacillus sp. FSL A5-0031]